MMAQVPDRDSGAWATEASPLDLPWPRVAIAPPQLPDPESLDFTPNFTPDFTLDFTPDFTPNFTPDFTPDFTPNFTPDFTPSDRPIPITLTRDQTRYLTKVLRLQAGDRFIALLDRSQPQGLAASLAAQSPWWEAAIANATQAHLIAPLPVPPERSPVVWLVAAVPKGSGFDEVVRQCTEVGVAVIVPLVSDRTVAQPKETKVERWQRIASEAAEQSERVAVPRIEPPQSWDGAIARLPASAHRYLAATRRDAPPLLSQCRQDAQAFLPSLTAQDEGTPERPTIAIAIGPEGGWSAAEVERAIAAKFVPVSLGTTILRAVTAPVVAVAVAIAAWDQAIALRRSG